MLRRCSRRGPEVPLVRLLAAQEVEDGHAALDGVPDHVGEEHDARGQARVGGIEARIVEPDAAAVLRCRESSPRATPSDSRNHSRAQPRRASASVDVAEEALHALVHEARLADLGEPVEARGTGRAPRPIPRRPHATRDGDGGQLALELAHLPPELVAILAGQPRQVVVPRRGQRQHRAALLDARRPRAAPRTGASRGRISAVGDAARTAWRSHSTRCAARCCKRACQTSSSLPAGGDQVEIVGDVDPAEDAKPLRPVLVERAGGRRGRRRRPRTARICSGRSGAKARAHSVCHVQVRKTDGAAERSSRPFQDASSRPVRAGRTSTFIGTCRVGHASLAIAVHPSPPPSPSPSAMASSIAASRSSPRSSPISSPMRFIMRATLRGVVLVEVSELGGVGQGVEAGVFGLDGGEAGHEAVQLGAIAARTSGGLLARQGAHQDAHPATTSPTVILVDRHAVVLPEISAF